MGKPNLAYAVDAGQIKSAFNRWLVRNEASKASLIITRAAAAAKRLRSFGVTAPIEVTADNAFNYRPDPADADLLSRTWPEAGQHVVGMALVDFYQWPVKMKLWGRKQDCYKWPIYFNHSPERLRATESLARNYAALADDLITRHDKSIALIAMEGLDEAFVRKVHGLMAHPDRARAFCSNQYNASEMVSVLRSLELLVTSRYHACVLSLAGQMPQIAVGHDLRLKTIYQELGLFDEFFVTPDPDNLYGHLLPRIEQLLDDPSCVKDRLQQGYEKHKTAALRNRTLFRNFVQAYSRESVPSVTFSRKVAA